MLCLAGDEGSSGAKYDVDSGGGLTTLSTRRHSKVLGKR